MDILFYVLSVVGVTTIVTQSFIFSPIREWVKSKHDFLGTLIECPTCFGFWVGVFLSLHTYSPFYEVTYSESWFYYYFYWVWVRFALDGAIASIVATFATVLFELVSQKTLYLESKSLLNETQMRVLEKQLQSRNTHSDTPTPEQ